MKNLISIVEIPTSNFSRAVAFYNAILDMQIEEIDMGGVKMGLFPNEGEGIFVHLSRVRNINLRQMVLLFTSMGEQICKTSSRK